MVGSVFDIHMTIDTIYVLKSLMKAWSSNTKEDIEELLHLNLDTPGAIRAKNRILSKVNIRLASINCIL